MAPVMNSRLPRMHVFVDVCLLLGFIYSDASALLVYDRLTLLILHHKLTTSDARSLINLPPHLSNIPDYLLCAPCAFQPRKRTRRHGKQGGLLVKFKGLLRSGNSGLSHLRLNGYLYEWRHRWILPLTTSVYLDWENSSYWRREGIPRSGTISRNLHQLARGPALDNENLTFREALLNARSVTHKTFILNYIFISKTGFYVPVRNLASLW